MTSGRHDDAFACFREARPAGRGEGPKRRPAKKCLVFPAGRPASDRSLPLLLVWTSSGGPAGGVAHLRCQGRLAAVPGAAATFSTDFHQERIHWEGGGIAKM